MFILGDFNIDFSRKNSDADKVKLKDIDITKYNMRQLVNKTTHSTSNSNSLIDLNFTTLSPDLVVESGTLNVSISDHLPIYVIKKKKREKHPTKVIHIRRTAMYSYNNFACVLIDNYGVNELWDIMVNIITDTLDIICPWSQIRIREDQPSWYDGEINSLIRDQNNQYTTACMLRTPSEWEKLKTCKKLVRATINKKNINLLLDN